MKKTAEVTTPLQEHQKRAVKKAVKNNLLIHHGLGSGKTLTALKASEEIGRPTTFVVPASLRENIKKEIQKHTKGGLGVPYDLMSYHKFSRTEPEELPENRTYVFDETHAVRNPSSNRSRLFKDVAAKDNHLIMLSGTSLYNDPADVVPLIYGMHGGSQSAKMDKSKFKKEFIKTKVVPRTVWQHLTGIKAGKQDEITGGEKLKKLIKGKIDYHVEKDNENNPEQKERTVEVPLSDSQYDIYKYLEKGMPSSLRRKVKANLPPNKTESKQLNAFLTGVRQASLSERPFVEGLTALEAAKQSNKIRMAVKNLIGKMDNDKNFRGLTYSNYIGAGIEPYSAMLKEKGVPHNVYTGKLSDEEKKKAVDEYNEGKKPVLLVSSSGGQGLDLKGTKLIQILEPHFNDKKIQQVIGRGSRFKSHTHLPEEERKVEVERYIAKRPQNFLDKLLKRTRGAADEYLYNRALDKDKLMGQLHKIMKESD